MARTNWVTLLGVAVGGFILYKAFESEGEGGTYAHPEENTTPLPDDPRLTQTHGTLDGGVPSGVPHNTGGDLKAAIFADPEFQVNPNKNRLSMWDWNYYYARATGKQPPDIHKGIFKRADGSQMSDVEIQATAWDFETWQHHARNSAVSNALSGLGAVQFTYPGPAGARPGTLETARGYERKGFNRLY